MCIGSLLLPLFAYLSVRSFWVFADRGSVKKSLQSEFFGVAQNWLHCVAAVAISNVIVMRWCCCLRYIFVTAVGGRHECKHCGIPIRHTNTNNNKIYLHNSHVYFFIFFLIEISFPLLTLSLNGSRPLNAQRKIATKFSERRKCEIFPARSR